MSKIVETTKQVYIRMKDKWLDNINCKATENGIKKSDNLANLG